ncbi:MAG: Hpt domain-containing protein [Saccharospirillaceae bacterium]|nr:Hpt domain-containing protein [Pseudomonadales bacterium]NRB80334.1 Hpt domain-containing protein [Saccharospirillaceae bacterium]
MSEFRTEQLDQEIVYELLEEFTENLSQAENQIIDLEQHPNNNETLNALFRNIHTVKGNLGMAQLLPLVPVLQELEDVLSLLRQGELVFNSKIGDLSLLLLDHVQQFLNDSVSSDSVLYDAQLYEDVGIEINKISNHSDPDQQILKAISLLDPNFFYSTQLDVHSETNAFHQNISEQYPELSYFFQLMPVVESRLPRWKGRTTRLLNLAQRMCELNQSEFDFEQLAAAIYAHDIAMSFLPLKLLTHAQPMTKVEYTQVKSHVFACGYLLAQSDHWKEAARILNEHHEWVNGNGYPKGLTEQNIHPGALCLSVLHAYEAITHGHYYQSDYQRPMKQALSELSKLSNQQFSSHWVTCLLNSVYLH